MLTFYSLQFLAGTQGLFDRLASPKTCLKLIINNEFEYPIYEGQTVQLLTRWQAGAFQPIEVSPYQAVHNLEFVIYRNSELLGVGRSFVNYAQNKKDCIEVMSDQNYVIGKFLYEVQWNQPMPGKMITFEQYSTYKDKNKGKIYVAKELKVDSTTEQDMDTCCGCFGGSGKRRPKNINTGKSPQIYAPVNTKTPQPLIFAGYPSNSQNTNNQNSNAPRKFQNKPQLYFQQDLQPGSNFPNQKPKPVTFYSKSVYASK